MTVYLIHFASKLSGHANHYLGYTADLDARIELHRSGGGAKILRAANEAGIEWHVVRTWKGGRTLERRLKKFKKSRQLCPVCREEAKRANKLKQGNRNPKRVCLR